MRDVALKAGVSIKTVSRVVNDQGEISEATRQKVIVAIDELGYRPSLVARALVTQSTYTVGLVAVDIRNPFFPEVAHGVIETARCRGYNVFLCNTGSGPDLELGALRSLADRSVDGIIFYPSYESGETIKAFAQNYHPMVVINHTVDQPGTSQVRTDNKYGAKLAVDYLVQQEHRAIGMLTGVANGHPSKVRRVQGYHAAMNAHDLPIEEGWVVPTSTPTVECGYEAARYLLTQHPEITAIFAYNDLLAIGALKACHELGRRVPDDCAIVGFDDIQLAAMVIPSLTSVRVNKYKLGQQAMNRLFDMMGKPEATFPPITLTPELIIRESA